ncbi:hypothetical protein [Amycolatopsis azurea]|uniref:Uncharacterized protein n=1 Tax=Amycolatopsis azurea DSM 43854 TaxID=1238180 RepID=M2PX04_9PSEU|nr:hypothetical protein [Amycolatopsis azurea]EMD24145.1 hypothetical protein C791_6223 [Amycolatopsis azurea DSM 43854]OOC08024.1 hypothetical protein B0293_03820 [Amycolatopsis azurea DSM 43854]
MDTQTSMVALEVMEIDEASIIPFFTMVAEAYEAMEDKENLDGFKAKLNEKSDFPAERELFLRHVEDTDRMELVRHLAELGADEIQREWEAAQAAGQPDEEDEPDRAPFVADLQTYSGYWDRTEEGWPVFTDAFQGYAEGTHGQVAVGFFERAAAGEDKQALFAEFEVTFADDGEPDDPMKAVGERFATLWAEFDGTRESWDQCRDLTYGAANEADPQLYAMVYEQFQALEELPMPDRVTRLNEWGFDLSATGEEDEDATFAAMDAMFDEETIAETTRRLTDAAATALPEEASRVIGQAFDDVLAELPWAGNLTQEEIDEVLASVKNDLQTS